MYLFANFQAFIEFCRYCYLCMYSMSKFPQQTQFLDLVFRYVFDYLVTQLNKFHFALAIWAYLNLH